MGRGQVSHGCLAITTFAGEANESGQPRRQSVPICRAEFNLKNQLLYSSCHHLRRSLYSAETTDIDRPLTCAEILSIRFSSLFLRRKIANHNSFYQHILRKITSFLLRKGASAGSRESFPFFGKGDLRSHPGAAKRTPQDRALRRSAFRARSPRRTGTRMHVARFGPAAKKPPPVPLSTLLRTRNVQWVPQHRVLDPTTLGWACKRRPPCWLPAGTPSVRQKLRRFTNTAEVSGDSTTSARSFQAGLPFPPFPERWWSARLECLQ